MMKTIRWLLAALAVSGVAACGKKTEDKKNKIRGATPSEFATVLSASSPEQLRSAIDAITKAHPDLKVPAHYDSGHVFVDLEHPWIGQVQCDVNEQTGAPRGACMFFFRSGCCDDPAATAKLVDALAKLDPELQPVEKKIVDAVAGKVEYDLGERGHFSTGGGFAGTLSVCNLQRGDACLRIAKAIAAGPLPAPADLIPNLQKK